MLTLWIAMLLMQVPLMQDKDAALGERMAAEVRRETKPIANATVRDYIDRLGRKLSPAHFSFEPILDDRREPLALPGGIVFVTSTSILKARDETEFAGVLSDAMCQKPAGGWLGPLPKGMQEKAKVSAIEADRKAVRMASDAGFDPAGLLRYLERLEPRPEERIAALREAVRALPAHPDSPNPEFPMVQAAVRALMPPPPSLFPRR